MPRPNGKGVPAPIDASTPAIVFKLTGDRLQHGTLGIARSLGRLGIPVHLLTANPTAPPSRSRYVVRSAAVPDVAAGAPDADVLDALHAAAERAGDRPVLIAADDVAALFVEDHLPELAPRFRLPDQPPGLAHRLSDKRELHGLCLDLGIPSPETRFPTTAGEMLRAGRELRYPLVLKAMDPVTLRRRPGAPSVAVARSAEEALADYERMEDVTRPNVMVQDFIPGGPQSIWMFNGYFDAHGACHLGVVGKKIRQAPPDTGATSLGAVVANDVVRDLAARFLGDLGYRGMVDLGFRFDARDGRYKLLDVNPRIGSTFRLFADGAGLDVVRAQYLDLTGQAVPAATTREGRRWIVEDQDLATALKLARRGRLGLRGYVSSLRGVQEAAWFARDDLRPLGRLLVETARTAASRGSERSRRAARRASRDSRAGAHGPTT